MIKVGPLAGLAFLLQLILHVFTHVELSLRAQPIGGLHLTKLILMSFLLNSSQS